MVLKGLYKSMGVLRVKWTRTGNYRLQWVRLLLTLLTEKLDENQQPNTKVLLIPPLLPLVNGFAVEEGQRDDGSRSRKFRVESKSVTRQIWEQPA